MGGDLLYLDQDQTDRVDAESQIFDLFWLVATQP